MDTFQKIADKISDKMEHIIEKVLIFFLGRFFRN